MISSSAKRNGFTLIEIMIIVAVLAILVAAVVVAQKSVVIRSRNTRILSAVSQVRNAAESIYMNEGTGYLNLCDNPPSAHLNARNSDLNTLEDDIEESGGGIHHCCSSQNSYCLVVKLFNDQYFCIDDESHFGSSDSQVCEDADSICLP
ncbi:MAG: prepilin-type N-terminal cleavage/methylation domain-containing protein [Candidatus Pacebacteria bacterium]|nr:prepilin-type N-terminal cleavage/methylation domain-containing protein [Candidatus Paceibacterota bacterium]